jgi:uncharacterized DUF497 family protein
MGPQQGGAQRGQTRVTFEEATEVFAPGVVTMELDDVAHSEDEDRFRTVGPISRGLVLVVWTERHGDTVRIIGARFASRQESARYRQFVKGAL